MAKIVMLTVYFIQKFRKHTVLKTFFFFFSTPFGLEPGICGKMNVQSFGPSILK